MHLYIALTYICTYVDVLEFYYSDICIGYTIEKCGLCAHVTHEFAVILRRSQGINANEWVTAGA